MRTLSVELSRKMGDVLNFVQAKLSNKRTCMADRLNLLALALCFPQHAVLETQYSVFHSALAFVISRHSELF